MVRELADVGVYSDEPGEEGRLTTTFDFADHRLPMAAFQTPARSRSRAQTHARVVKELDLFESNHVC